MIGGVEFTANYTLNDFAAYLNSAWQAAHGKGVESAQFNFDQADLAYIASNYIHLDHEGRVSASGGVSYLWLGTRFSVDDLLSNPQRLGHWRFCTSVRAPAQFIWRHCLEVLTSAAVARGSRGA